MQTAATKRYVFYFAFIIHIHTYSCTFIRLYNIIRCHSHARSWSPFVYFRSIPSSYVCRAMWVSLYANAPQISFDCLLVLSLSFTHVWNLPNNLFVLYFSTKRSIDQASFQAIEAYRHTSLHHSSALLDGVRRLALHHYQWSIKNATPPSMYIIYQGRLEELHLPAIISSNLSSMRHRRRLWHCPSWWLFSTVNGIKFIVFVYGWVHIFFRGIMSMCVS